MTMLNTIGDRVKELRLLRGWNQRTLAQKSGISQATLSRIENRKVSQPKMAQHQKLAEAMGTTIEYLVTGKEGWVRATMQPRPNRVLGYILWGLTGIAGGIAIVLIVDTIR